METKLCIITQHPVLPSLCVLQAALTDSDQGKIATFCLTYNIQATHHMGWVRAVGWLMMHFALCYLVVKRLHLEREQSTYVCICVTYERQ